MATGRIPDANTAPLTAKGDLYTYSTANARLAVGNNGDTLVADSAATTGLRWQGSQAAGKNAVINGGFDNWQRGTSFTALGKTFTADRWWKFRGSDASGGTWSRQNSASSAPNTQYCMRIQRDSGNTGTTHLSIYSDLETSTSIGYAGQTVVVSFYARKGANYSGGDFAVSLQTGTGTDQSQYAGFTNETVVLTVSATAASMNTSTFVRYSGSVTLATTVTQLGLRAFFTPTGTAGAADFVEVTGIQLEVGTAATAFTRSGGTLQGELAACQRYYTRFTTTAGTFGYGMGSTFNTTDGYCVVALPVTMRTTPTLGTTGTPSNYRVYNGSNGFGNLTAIALQNGGYNQCLISFTSSALSTNTPVWLASDTGLNGYLEFRAEL